MNQLDKSGISTRISPKYTTDDWKLLSFNDETDWHRAVEIFRDRYESRFFRFIDRLDQYQYSGFLIVAIDCLLIETLQQFFLGIKESPERKNKKLFVDFLTNTSFSRYFDEEKADRFYKCIRCGLLHQSEVKGSSKILIDEKTPLVKNPEQGYGLIINRRLFHKELFSVYLQYINDLLMDNGNKELRLNFRKKMDFIANNPFEP